jgi:hypothetical protein
VGRWSILKGTSNSNYANRRAKERFVPHRTKRNGGSRGDSDLRSDRRTPRQHTCCQPTLQSCRWAVGTRGARRCTTLCFDPRHSNVPAYPMVGRGSGYYLFATHLLASYAGGSYFIRSSHSVDWTIPIPTERYATSFRDLPLLAIVPPLPVRLGHRSFREKIVTYERKHRTRDRETCSARKTKVTDEDALAAKSFSIRTEDPTRCTSAHLSSPLRPMQPSAGSA